MPCMKVYTYISPRRFASHCSSHHARRVATPSATHRTRRPPFPHDYIDRSDYGVALVGSGTDDDIVQEFRKDVENNSIAVFYAHATNGEQQRKAVEDFAKRKVTFIVIPLCILLVITQMNREGGWSATVASGAWRDAVVSAVAGVVGMIPEGLVLLTSLNFAIAAMRLARQNTLVQGLEAVETLARVDCLNLDKTGTITNGGIVFDAIRMLPDDSAGTATPSDAIRALRDVCDEATPNITGAAALDAIEAICHRDPLSGIS